MIEILETGIPSKHMVYVTNDETKMLDSLFRIKQPSATYYNTKEGGKVIAYHWLLNPITIRKRGIQGRYVSLPPE